MISPHDALNLVKLEIGRVAMETEPGDEPLDEDTKAHLMALESLAEDPEALAEFLNEEDDGESDGDPAEKSMW